MYTVGSLFTGIGGIDLAFSAAGFDVLFQVEIDDFCRKVLTKHASSYWPNATQFTDIRDVGGHNLPRVDCLFGGFPCQDLSVAGKRAGLGEGTRSGLWFEFARLIGDLRPRLVFLENVPGILTLGGTQVIADLAKMGYVGHWGTLSAADAGAPHRRERWFCVAYRQSSGDQRECRGLARPTRQAWQQNDGAITERQGQNRTAKLGNAKQFGTAIRTARQTRTAYTYYGRDYPTDKQERNAKQSRIARASQLGHAKYPRLQGRQSQNRPRHAPTAISLPSRANARRELEPRLGRDAHGLPAGLDGHQWPARPGQPQYDYEPPRVVSAQPHRTARLKALGNAVVPAVAYPIACEIRDWLDAQPAPEAEGVA